MSRLLLAIWIACVGSGMASAEVYKGNYYVEDKRIFAYFAKAILLEFCYRDALEPECELVNKRLDGVTPEIYFYNGKDKKQTLVVFDLEHWLPHVYFGYDEQRNIKKLRFAFWGKRQSVEIDAFKSGGTYAE